MRHLLISKRLSHTNLPNRALQWIYYTRLKKQRVAKYPTGREGLETRHHNNPATDVFAPLQGNGVALSIDPYADYQVNSRSGLPKGVIILIGTDGLWEIDQGFGCTHCKGMIKDLVRRHRHENAVSIAEVIKSKVGECCRGLPAEDDMTLITIKFKDGPKATGETS